TMGRLVWGQGYFPEVFFWEKVKPTHREAVLAGVSRPRVSGIGSALDERALRDAGNRGEGLGRIRELGRLHAAAELCSAWTGEDARPHTSIGSSISLSPPRTPAPTAAPV